MWPRVQNKASQRLTEFCQENALVIANTLFQQHKRRLHMDITSLLIPKSDGLYSLQPKMETLYTGSKNRTRSWLWLRSWTLYCQIQNEIEEISKTSRPFRYDLNQIHYNYTVKVTNRFKGLDLIDRVPEEIWTEVCDIVQEAVIKTIPKKKKCKKAKWLFEKALQKAEKRREAKSKGEKARYTHLNAKNRQKRLESLPQWSKQRNKGKQ